MKIYSAGMKQQDLSVRSVGGRTQMPSFFQPTPALLAVLQLLTPPFYQQSRIDTVESGLRLCRQKLSLVNYIGSNRSPVTFSCSWVSFSAEYATWAVRGSASGIRSRYVIVGKSGPHNPRGSVPVHMVPNETTLRAKAHILWMCDVPATPWLSRVGRLTHSSMSQ